MGQPGFLHPDNWQLLMRRKQLLDYQNNNVSMTNEYSDNHNDTYYDNDDDNKQESLANAKVSARQPRYIGRNSLNRPPLRISQQYQSNLYIVEK